jgi:hypothetical protein
MKRFSTIGLTSCAALVSLAGCGGGTHSSTGAFGAMPSIPIAASQLSAPAVGANLYVGNSEGAGGIAVYAPGSDKPLRTIPVTAVSALAIRSSNLYVACRFADVRVARSRKA